MKEMKEFMYGYTVAAAASLGRVFKTDERGAWMLFWLQYTLYCVIATLLHQHFHNGWTGVWVVINGAGTIGALWICITMDVSFTTFFNRPDIRAALNPRLVNYWLDQQQGNN
jgi:hypothetical protein